MSNNILIKKAVLLILILMTEPSKAQAEIENISKTIFEYIQGTANGEPERVKKAFQPDFQLFLISADTLRIIDGKQYIANIEKGKKYNRIGRVVSIDYENNAASAKVEVFFPESNRLATDYLLLLKTMEGWKILHKAINVTVKNEDDLVAFPDKNETQNIQKTLYNYFEGTAQSKDERIKMAFWEGLNLYSIKEGKISVMPREKYLEYFTKGKNYNRIGKILSIDIEKDAALAKLEIKMPDRNRVAIDYVLLLKINNSWKIVHKSFTDKDYKFD